MNTAKSLNNKKTYFYLIFVLKLCAMNLFRAALYKLVFVLHEDALFH
jgi:hypothetical protein